MAHVAENILLFSVISDEVRAAWIDYNRSIQDIQIFNQSKSNSSRGNIYVGTVIRKEKALSAYFVDYVDDNGILTQGFLPWKETHKGLSKSCLFVENFVAEDGVNYPNSELEIGQKILVQIVRDKRDNKGAALTTFISLPGSFLVLLPNNPETTGVSRKVDLQNKDQLKELIKDLEFPDDMGIIMRTAGLSLSKDLLQKDLNNLLEKWNTIKQNVKDVSSLTKVHKEPCGLEKLIRDSLGVNVSKIIVDDSSSYSLISKYVQNIRPDYTGEIELYTSKVPLFTHFQVQQQLETIYLREVPLPSGGSIVFDRTEAMTVVDVNSGKSIKSSSIEATAINTNIEAAKVIATQLQLRDIGGLIVIDFIDMINKSDRENVENTFKKALSSSSARTHVFEISKLGLLEMSRQRVKPSVGDSHLLGCKVCQKKGYIRSAESFSASIIHVLEENAVHSENCILQIQVPNDVANFLWNNKASHILHLEKKYNIEVIVVANSDYFIPKFQLKRIQKANKDASIYEVNASQNADLSALYTKKYHLPTQEDSIKQPGLFTTIWNKVFSSAEETKTTKVVNKNNKNNRKRRAVVNKSGHESSDSSINKTHHKKDKARSNNRRRRNYNKTASNKNIGVTANNQSSSEQDYL